MVSVASFDAVFCESDVCSSVCLGEFGIHLLWLLIICLVLFMQLQLITCPLNRNCLQSSVIYQATVKHNDNNTSDSESDSDKANTSRDFTNKSQLNFVIS